LVSGPVKSGKSFVYLVANQQLLGLIMTTNTPYQAQQARFNMIEQQIRPWNVLDLDVLALLDTVPRDQFVPVGQEALAYVDTQLPLPCGECMLEPRIEARMLQDLAIQPHETVLEIGTGSGYMAALLAHRAAHVVSLELHQELADMAKANLKRAGVHNVEVVCADAATYKHAKAPFDVIVLSGSVAQVPASLLSQLKVLGRLMAIVGQQPMMHAQLVQSESELKTTITQPWDAVIPPLKGFPVPTKFKF
jgi:protein-L-isoaspartate(D-aspartate) O-methyltransferase